jgi:SAM-dependent methyltransferase
MLKNILFFIKFVSFYLTGRNPIFELYLKGKKTLDLGSGEGDFIKLDPKNIVGLDINKGAVERCLAKGYQIKEGLVTKVPFLDGEFDVIHCRNVVEHLTPSEARQMFLEMKRVLKNKGIIILITPMPCRVWDTFGHIKPYPPMSIRKLFRKVSLESFETISGLEIEKIIYFSRWSGWKVFSFILNILAQLLPFSKGSYLMIIKKNEQ